MSNWKRGYLKDAPVARTKGETTPGKNDQNTVRTEFEQLLPFLCTFTTSDGAEKEYLVKISSSTALKDPKVIPVFKPLG